MKKNKKIVITFLISSKSGVLSSILMIGDSIGLVFVKQQIQKLNANNSRVVVYFEGDFICSKKDTIKSFEEHPKIFKVERIIVEKDNDTSTDKNV